MDSKARYHLCLGDFKKIHRCGMLKAESFALEHELRPVEEAARDLIGMIDIEETPHSTV